jgi:hypothetical protein
MPLRSISLTQAFATLLILAATAWCYTAWGMWMSWLCRRTPVAIGWTIGTMFFATVLLPITLTISGSSSLSQLLWLVHPLYAFFGTMEPDEFQRGNSDPLPYAAGYSLILFFAGCAILLLLHRNMKDRAREPDTRHGTA